MRTQKIGSLIMNDSLLEEMQKHIAIMTYNLSNLSYNPTISLLDIYPRKDFYIYAKYCT